MSDFWQLWTRAARAFCETKICVTALLSLLENLEVGVSPEPSLMFVKLKSVRLWRSTVRAISSTMFWKICAQLSSNVSLFHNTNAGQMEHILPPSSASPIWDLPLSATCHQFYHSPGSRNSIVRVRDDQTCSKCGSVEEEKGNRTEQGRKASRPKILLPSLHHTCLHWNFYQRRCKRQWGNRPGDMTLVYLIIMHPPPPPQHTHSINMILICSAPDV